MTTEKRETYTQARTAKDPEAYVRKMNQTYATDPRGFSFTIESIDGETKSGQKRYTLRVTHRA